MNKPRTAREFAKYAASDARDGAYKRAEAQALVAIALAMTEPYGLDVSVQNRDGDPTA